MRPVVDGEGPGVDEPWRDAARWSVVEAFDARAGAGTTGAGAGIRPIASSSGIAALRARPLDPGGEFRAGGVGVGGEEGGGGDGELFLALDRQFQGRGDRPRALLDGRRVLAPSLWATECAANSEASVPRAKHSSARPAHRPFRDRPACGPGPAGSTGSGCTGSGTGASSSAGGVGSGVGLGGCAVWHGDLVGFARCAAARSVP